MRWQARRAFAILTLIAAAGVWPIAQQRPVQAPPAPNGEWPSYGGTNWSQKYSALDQITRDNFKNLQIAWTWRTPDVELAKALADRIDPAWTPNGFKATPSSRRRPGLVSGLLYALLQAGQEVGRACQTADRSLAISPALVKR
ncbi:MAG: hypothetical protein A3H97_18780 [Acidobacteria bacterium RIFCSPLOWO2_02_FULL_65_29]|nr:MAG: hypothetical protein A3H97_18780 [Acidobacteria bacterium RIFCSPLOWO2_02_FULL_65_29]